MGSEEPPIGNHTPNPNPLISTSEPVQYPPATPELVTSSDQQSNHKHDGWHNVISTSLILILAPVVAVCLTLFVFQSYQVDGPSMQPTLQNNDRLIVLKLPKTWSKITGKAYVPNRGDVIIFAESNISEFNQGTPKQLVKRVIGLPGDRVVVKDDKLTVYNSKYPNGFDPDTTLPYSQGVASSTSVTTGNIDITVPSGQVFVCGDNRVNSLDSRNFGTVPVSNIVGKLVLRIFPLSTTKSF